MNFIIFLIFTSFSLKGSVCFPIGETSANLNPGFEIEMSKYFGSELKKWGFTGNFKGIPFKEGSGANFNVFSFGMFLTFSAYQNFHCGISIFESFIELKKKEWSEEGFAPGACVFLKFIFGESPVFMQGGVDFIKGREKDLWIFKLGFEI